MFSKYSIANSHNNHPQYFSLKGIFNVLPQLEKVIVISGQLQHASTSMSHWTECKIRHGRSDSYSYLLSDDDVRSSAKTQKHDQFLCRTRLYISFQSFSCCLLCIRHFLSENEQIQNFSGGDYICFAYTCIPVYPSEASNDNLKKETSRGLQKTAF